MLLVYQPEGSEEPQVFPYDPRKLMSVERELVEKLTGFDYATWTQKVMVGHSRARRSLLFVMLKRQHPKLRFDDVDFAWDELTIQHSRQEYDSIIDQVESNIDLTPAEKAVALEKLRMERETAYDDPGKAVRPPIVE